MGFNFGTQKERGTQRQESIDGKGLKLELEDFMQVLLIVHANQFLN
jgi:hypothetical protein